ncbi:MAG: hypothetical protein PHT33_03870 [bacterium]|nr:hypothetical protein [bacterium]
MKYIKTIVCFANSRKTSGRCIAGKEWRNGEPGEWVRPVSNRSTHEVSEEEYCYENGQEPQLLDIFQIQCKCSQPLSHQCENHLIDTERYWVNQGKLAWKDIGDWLDNPNTLWGVGAGSYSGFNNRIAIGQENGISLYLIAVDSLRLLVGRKAPEYSDSKRAVRGEVIYRDTIYRMDITDPVVKSSYLNQPDGQYEIQRPVICVSLSDPYQGFFYKLIAAVLYQERFG